MIRGILHEVGAEQQPVVRAELAAHRAQEPPPRAGQEVPHRPAQQGDDPRARGLGQRVEVALEVADDAVDLQPWVLLDELRGGGEHGRLGDVERHVAAQRPVRGHGVEQHARLRRVAGAELHELARAGVLGHLPGDRLEDPPLRAGRVVLRQLRDALEQLGAVRVVEVLGGQLLGGPREPVEDVLGEGALVAGAQARGDPDGGGRHQSPCTSLRPAKICRRSGRSQLRNDVVAMRGWVVHAPPRRTR